MSKLVQCVGQIFDGSSGVSINTLYIILILVKRWCIDENLADIAMAL